MGYETIRLLSADGVATITLARPDAFNALNLALGRELFHAALLVSEDPAVRSVVLTGEGKAFCGGGDVLGQVVLLLSLSHQLRDFLTHGRHVRRIDRASAAQQFEQVSQPSVNGSPGCRVFGSLHHAGPDNASPLVEYERPPADELNASGYGFYTAGILEGLAETPYDEMIAGDVVWVGTPEDVIERIEAVRDVCEGLTEISITVNPGGFEHWQAIKNQELFAHRVMPHFTG